MPKNEHKKTPKSLKGQKLGPSPFMAALGSAKPKAKKKAKKK